MIQLKVLLKTRINIMESTWGTERFSYITSRKQSNSNNSLFSLVFQGHC